MVANSRPFYSDRAMWEIRLLESQLDEARATISRLNKRAQEAESALAKYRNLTNGANSMGEIVDYLEEVGASRGIRGLVEDLKKAQGD